MSKLLEFTSFIRDRKIAVADIEVFTQQLIETVSHPDGAVGYKLKPLKSTDKITQRCKILVYYTWHCRDYVKKILTENGSPDPGQIVNNYIKASRDIQVLSYLANEYKHAGVDSSQKWAADIAPRYAKPYAQGVMLGFPHQLKPTFITWGDSLAEIEFVGNAGVGDLAFQFTDFTWTFSCTIEDKDGAPLGDAVAMCENTFKIWLQILSDNGIVVIN